MLEFLPELMEEKGINISEILDELKERKNSAGKKFLLSLKSIITHIKIKI